MKTIKGKFEVKSTPLPLDEDLQSLGAMRMMFEKKFEGALAADGLVSMMGLMNGELGSGGYVALERVTGSVEGRDGSFCLQHSSTMERGKQKQSITVIPDSGTGQLQGISGSMVVEIVKGQHFYNFEYSLPKT